MSPPTLETSVPGDFLIQPLCGGNAALFCCPHDVPATGLLRKVFRYTGAVYKTDAGTLSDAHYIIS